MFKSIKKIFIPQGVTDIGAYAFKNCESLSVLLSSNKNKKSDGRWY